MNNFYRITEALAQLEEQKYEPPFHIMYLNPKDRKRIHVNKISIRFMQLVKRNRKKRRP